jgi:NAD(P)H dehydrogenase (quinone)
VVPPGYTAASVALAGGNPYGVSHTPRGDRPAATTLAVARYQGARLATLAGLLSADQPAMLVNPGGEQQGIR